LFEGELSESDHETKCRRVFEWICRQTNKIGKPIKRQTIFGSRQADSGDYDRILITLMEQGKIMYEERKLKNDWLYWPNNQSVEDS
jgi:hypothetical protein